MNWRQIGPWSDQIKFTAEKWLDGVDSYHGYILLSWNILEFHVSVFQQNNNKYNLSVE